MQQLQQTAQALELDYLIGFSGRFPNAYYLPGGATTIIYAIGSQVVLENLQQRSDQSFLRGHDMPVSALAVSLSGRYIASGQLGSKGSKTAEAPVILWDVQSRSVVNVYRGLRDAIAFLAFSPDDRFLAAASSAPSNALTVWSTTDFSVVHNRITENATQLLAWCAGSAQLFVTTSGTSQIVLNTLEYNAQTRQGSVKQANFQLPSTGLVRQYTRALAHEQNLYVGTASGELCVFNIPNRVFKAAIPVSNNGVTSLALLQEQLFVGAGDGRLKKLVGQDSKWAFQVEVQLEGQIHALTLSPDGKELLAATTASKLYRVLTSSLLATLHLEGHLTAIAGLALPPVQRQQQSFAQAQNQPFLFATIDAQGYIYVFDLARLTVITRCSPGTMQRAPGLCVCIADDGQVVGGYEDGFVRSFEATSNTAVSPLKWEIVNAHKGGVTAIYVDQYYVISGGRDGIVRVWARQTRKFVAQISSHTKDVVAAFPDAKTPNQIHSASIDKIVHTHDLSTDKKVIFRQLKNGQILHLSQRPDTLDLVTCGQNTNISFWNNTTDKPIGELAYPEQVNCVEPSPSGRFLALGTATGEIAILQAPQFQLIGKFAAHSAGVSKLKWVFNEKKILSASLDGSICIWNFYAQ